MRKPLGAVFRTLAWGVALEAAMAFAGLMLAQNATGSTAVQAVMAEFGAGRLSVTWSDPDRPMPTTGVILRRVGAGAALALGASVLFLVVALGTKTAELRSMGGVNAAQLASGVIVAALLAVRDELVLRGVVLRALDGAIASWAAWLVCGLAAAASSWGATGAAWESVSAGALGVSFAVLWTWDRGAWLPVGANATFRFFMATLTQGALFDLRAASNVWGGGDAGLLAGRVGAMVAVGIAIFASFACLRKNRRRSYVDSQ